MSQLDDNIPWWRVVYADGTPATCRHRTGATHLTDEPRWLDRGVDMR